MTDHTIVPPLNVARLGRYYETRKAAELARCPDAERENVRQLFDDQLNLVSLGHDGDERALMALEDAWLGLWQTDRAALQAA